MERLSAQAIQNYIVIAQGSFEIVFLVVDDDICTDALHLIDIRRARGRRDDRTEMLGEPDCKRSYSTRARVDENFLPFLQVRSFYQRLPGSQADQRDGSCVFHGELFGLVRYRVFSYGDEFRERTDSILVRARIDFVARLESAHCGSDADYDSGQIIAQK